MDLERLRAVAVAEPREIMLADGSVATFHFKRIGAALWMQFQSAQALGEPEQMVDGQMLLIASSLCEADGKAAITIDQARTLDQDVAMSMFRAAIEVNRVRDRGKS